MTSSNGNIFRVTGPLCGEFTDHRWISLTKASDEELWCFLHRNKRLSLQSWDCWFETSSRSLWRHCNDLPNSWEGERTAFVWNRIVKFNNSKFNSLNGNEWNLIEVSFKCIGESSVDDESYWLKKWFVVLRRSRPQWINNYQHRSN